MIKILITFLYLSFYIHSLISQTAFDKELHFFLSQAIFLSSFKATFGFCTFFGTLNFVYTHDIHEKVPKIDTCTKTKSCFKRT